MQQCILVNREQSLEIYGMNIIRKLNSYEK